LNPLNVGREGKPNEADDVCAVSETTGFENPKLVDGTNDVVAGIEGSEENGNFDEKPNEGVV
jgi:hypothetical protein